MNPHFKLFLESMDVYGMRNFHICEGTINAKWNIHICLDQHLLPSRQSLFQGPLCAFQQDDANPYSTCVIIVCVCSKKLWVLDWPLCSSEVCVVHYDAQNMTTKTPN